MEAHSDCYGQFYERFGEDGLIEGIAPSQPGHVYSCRNPTAIETATKQFWPLEFREANSA